MKSYMMFLVEKANYIKYIKIFVQKKKRGGGEEKLTSNIEFKSSKKKKKKKGRMLMIRTDWLRSQLPSYGSTIGLIAPGRYHG